jgi:hypothetical protein
MVSKSPEALAFWVGDQAGNTRPYFHLGFSAVIRHCKKSGSGRVGRLSGQEKQPLILALRVRMTAGEWESSSRGG